MRIKISGSVTLKLTLQTAQLYTCVHFPVLIVLPMLTGFLLQGKFLGQLVDQHHRPDDRQRYQS